MAMSLPAAFQRSNPGGTSEDLADEFACGVSAFPDEALMNLSGVDLRSASMRCCRYSMTEFGRFCRTPQVLSSRSASAASSAISLRSDAKFSDT